MLHANSWSFFEMHLFWWLFWTGLIVTTFTTVTRVKKSQVRTGERARDILRCRYAAGRISSERYEKRKAVLERDEPGAVAPHHG